MDYPISTYPATGAANENVLFASLGSFWTKVFSDKTALKGLTISQAEETFQSYYDLIEAIDSYSSSDISVFKKIKWMPIIIKKSDLNASIIKFGEGVKFGDTVSGTPYIFGKAAPQEDKVFVINLPDGLQEVSIITNRVISPSFVLVNNIDVQIKGNYLYIYNDPFTLPGISTFNIVDDNGAQVYFSNPLTNQQIPDVGMVLWMYNAKIDTDSLNFNIGYLFGVTLPTNPQSKDILDATVKLYSTGPNIQQLKAICGAFIGVKPILTDNETVEDIFTTATQTVIVTNANVYKYDLYYTLNPGIAVGTVLQSGDIPVDAIEFYDNVVFKDWWLTAMTPKIVQETNSSAKSPSFILPPYMFVGDYKKGLTFNNDFELVTRASNGTITFPVHGTPEDVQSFQTQINANQNVIAAAIGEIAGNGTSLANNSAVLINPLDFLFKTVFQNNTAMIKISFKTEQQLQYFTQYFNVIKGCLPKHVLFIFFFDISVPNDTYVAADNMDDTTLATYYPLQATTTVVSMNAISSLSSDQNALCIERLIIRTIPAGVSTRDYNLLDINKQA